MTALSRDSNARSAAAGVAATALAMLLCVAAAQAAPPAGSPNLYYGQPFAIWSDAHGSYCKVDPLLGSMTTHCDIGLADITQASAFVIGGGCGPLASDDSIKVSLKWSNMGYGCEVFPPPNGNGNVFCDLYDGSAPTQWGFSNIVQQPDGMLHGNATAVRISNTANGANGWCSANDAATDKGWFQCNRATVDAWETLYLVPLA
jgi:hypothetical protein